MKPLDFPPAACTAAVVLAGLLTACGASSGDTNATVSAVQASANDALLTAGVKAKLIGVDPDSTTTLGVHVAGGVATYSGHRSDAERGRVDAAARTIKGITQVRDELRVDPHLPTIRESAGDAALAARIDAEILTATGSTAVRVGVHNGVVNLSGSGLNPQVESAALAATPATPAGCEGSSTTWRGNRMFDREGPGEQIARELGIGAGFEADDAEAALIEHVRDDVDRAVLEAAIQRHPEQVLPDLPPGVARRAVVEDD